MKTRRGIPRMPSACIGMNVRLKPEKTSQNNVVKAIGWSEGEAPTASGGLVVAAFARGLDHPRCLHVLPHGDVLIAETNAPPRPEDNRG